MKKIICIVGPTASGKTKLAIELCKQFNGEVVSADSMQIYRGMDIGTAKPDMEERAGIVHHMFDIVAPDENYSVSRFVEDATCAIDNILLRGHVPIVVGGTGLYIDALLRGTSFAQFDQEYREELMKKSPEQLYELLRSCDPQGAETLHVNDVKRVTRALEVYHLTGKTIAEHNQETQKGPPRYDACMIGLSCRDRKVLYERIEKRIDQMIGNGLIDEIRRLQQEGIPQTATSMQAIGYKELWLAACGKEEITPAVMCLKQATRRLAKRQLTWFRRNPDIHWLYLDDEENFANILHASSCFIKNCSV